MLSLVLEVQVFPKLLHPVELEEALHAHGLLTVSGAVLVERVLVPASLEANLADVVRLSDMVLELDEGLEVLAPETELGQVWSLTQFYSIDFS